MVFEWVIALLIKYGLIGLIISSFLSSLVFIPGYSSFLIPLFIKARFNPWFILFALSVGAVAGEILNYYLGFIGSKYIYHQKIKDAEKWLNKWGEYAVFIVNLIPFFPADFVNVLVGFLRMDVKRFVIGVTAGKVIQYIILIFFIREVFIFFNFV